MGVSLGSASVPATPDLAPPVIDSHPDRWRMLAVLSAAELLGMALWFAGSAVAPELQRLWQLDGFGVAWLTIAVQLGFVAGTAISALLNLADVVPARTLFTSPH